MVVDSLLLKQLYGVFGVPRDRVEIDDFGNLAILFVSPELRKFLKNRYKDKVEFRRAVEGYDTMVHAQISAAAFVRVKTVQSDVETKPVGPGGNDDSSVRSPA